MANPQSNTPPNTAIAKVAPPPHVTRLLNFLRPRADILAQYAANLVSPDTLIKLACYEASRAESKWMETTTPESVYASLIIAAQLGLEPGHVRGEAYLVPFAGKCTLIPGYKGLIKLAMQSGLVSAVRGRPVYEGDEFEVMQGTEEYIRHRPGIGTNRRVGAPPEVIAAYAICRFKDGSTEQSALDRWELDKRRAASQMANGPAWKQWPEEMFAKTAIRHGSKQWPLGGRFALAVKVDEVNDTGKTEDLRGMIDLPDDAVSERPEQVQVIEKPSRIQQAAEQAGAAAAAPSDAKPPASSSKPAPVAGWTWDPEADGKIKGRNGERTAVVEQTGPTTYGWWLYEGDGSEVAQGERKSKTAAMDDVSRAK